MKRKLKKVVPSASCLVLSAKKMLTVALCAAGLSAFAEAPDAVQLWENGPYFATSNLGTSEVAEHPEYGALYTFDDAGTAVKSLLGDEWRVPSKDDLKGLLDSSKCTQTKVTDDAGEFLGYTFTGAADGYTDKSIFLPAAGFDYGFGRGDAGNFGSYWSSTEEDSEEEDSDDAWYLVLSGSEAYMSYDARSDGYSVRAVRITPPPPEPVEYLDWDDAQKKMTNAVCKVFEVVTNEMAVFKAGKTYVVLGNVTNATAGIVVEGTAANPTRLILCDGAELVVKCWQNTPGLTVTADKALVICGQVGGTGKLTATGGMWCAGIGSSDSGKGGTVTINGGVVTATGGLYGSGIGGGQGVAGGAVTINGGTVTATGDVDATGIGGGDSCGDHGTVTFGTKFSVLAGDDAASAQPVPQDDYVNDHSARYVHIEPAKPEISAVSAEGWLDLTVGDRIALDEETLVVDPAWGNASEATIKLKDGWTRDYTSATVDTWDTTALMPGRYSLAFRAGAGESTVMYGANFWKLGADWVVFDSSNITENTTFEADKTYLILGTNTVADSKKLTVTDGAKFEYAPGAGFKGGKLEMTKRYGTNVVEGGFFQIVEKIRGCADNPWEVGDGVEAYTNGTELVFVGRGTIADLSEIPSGLKTGIAAITINAGVTDAEAGAFYGFDKVAVTLPDNWQGELPDDHGNWRGATGATLMAYPTAVKNVKVQQRYPWNGKVDVDFDLTGAGDVKVTLSARVDGKKIKNPTVDGETTFDLGKGGELKDLRITWDAKADFKDEEVHQKIKVKLTVEKAEVE